MKKLFLLFVSILCSISIMSNAQITVAVTPDGDNYSVTVGETTITGLTAIAQGDVNVLAINRDGVKLLVRFTDVNTLVADGTVDGTEVHYASEAAATYALGFQIPNSDFEAWDNPTAAGEPNHWHGFNSASGSWAGSAQGTLGSSNDKRPYSEGTKSALITSGSVLGIINNGTMTNGQLNAGSMFATNTANHSHMVNTAPDYYTSLKAAPDAITTWLKFSQATTNTDFPYANFSSIIFDGSYYQDPEDKTYTNVAAKAQDKQIPAGAWRQIVIPFDYASYASNNAATNAILITISTNSTPGKGSDGDQVWIDDMTLVYNADITGITATGLNGFTFDAATHDYNISYQGDPISLNEDNFTVTADGRAAVIVKNVEDLGGGNYAITLGAYSADMMNASVYTITVTRQPDDVWVMGDVNGNGWAANVGALMTYNETDKTYTIEITATRGTSYFSFTKRLAEDAQDWDAIAPYRFGANTEGEGTNFVMRQMYLGQEIELAQDGWYNAFQIPAGTYTLTIKDLDGDRKLIIDSDSWPDARLLVYGSFNAWDMHSDLIEMTLADGIYSTEYESVDTGDGHSYFKFIKRQAGEQDEIIGAVSNGDFLVTAESLNTPLNITAVVGQAYKIPTGEFTLTADLENMVLTIGGSLPIDTLIGDVTGEGEVDIADVNAIINIILKKKTQADYPGNANLNDDDDIDISDVNAVINIILGKS